MHLIRYKRNTCSDPCCNAHAQYNINYCRLQTASCIDLKMKKCNDKEDDVSYPTTTSLHKAIMKVPEIPWTWRKSTTYDILMHLGFRQVSASFLPTQFRHLPRIFFP